jgi:hypothetical protein
MPRVVKTRTLDLLRATGASFSAVALDIPFGNVPGRGTASEMFMLRADTPGGMPGDTTPVYDHASRNWVVDELARFRFRYAQRYTNRSYQMERSRFEKDFNHRRRPGQLANSATALS